MPCPCTMPRAAKHAAVPRKRFKRRICKQNPAFMSVSLYHAIWSITRYSLPADPLLRRRKNLFFVINNPYRKWTDPVKTVNDKAPPNVGWQQDFRTDLTALSCIVTVLSLAFAKEFINYTLSKYSLLQYYRLFSKNLSILVRISIFSSILTLIFLVCSVPHRTSLYFF